MSEVLQGIAGGLTPDGGLPKWVKRRLDAGVDIQRMQGDIFFWQCSALDLTKSVFDAFLEIHACACMRPPLLGCVRRAAWWKTDAEKR